VGNALPPKEIGVRLREECMWTGGLEELIVKALLVFLEEPTDPDLKVIFIQLYLIVQACMATTVTLVF